MPVFDIGPSLEQAQENFNKAMKEALEATEAALKELRG